MIYCVFLGAFKDKRLKETALEFHRRLQPLWPVTWVEIPEKKGDLERWASPKKGKGLFISLDPQGETMDSGVFSQWVTRSPKDLYFLAWGAEGPLRGDFPPASKSLSLSPMTFSHEIARVLLMEQLYRAGATLKGHPYSKH